MFCLDTQVRYAIERLVTNVDADVHVVVVGAHSQKIVYFTLQSTGLSQERFVFDSGREVSHCFTVQIRLATH